MTTQYVNTDQLYYRAKDQLMQEADWQSRQLPFCFTVLISERWRLGFPGGSVIKNLLASAGDTGSIPELGGSHMPLSNLPLCRDYVTRALEPKSHNYWSWQAQSPALCSKKRHYNKKPSHCSERVAPSRHNYRKARVARKTQRSQKIKINYFFLKRWRLIQGIQELGRVRVKRTNEKYSLRL